VTKATGVIDTFNFWITGCLTIGILLEDVGKKKTLDKLSYSDYNSFTLISKYEGKKVTVARGGPISKAPMPCR